MPQCYRVASSREKAETGVGFQHNTLHTYHSQEEYDDGYGAFHGFLLSILVSVALAWMVVKQQ